MKVVQPISDTTDIPAKLRALADRLEGEHPGLRISLVVGGEIHCYGPVSGDIAIREVVWDFTHAIHKIMSLPCAIDLGLIDDSF